MGRGADVSRVAGGRITLEAERVGRQVSGLLVERGRVWGPSWGRGVEWSWCRFSFEHPDS